MSAPYDSIIIGGGHNGLVCAGFLARSGRRVLVIEAAGQVGGMAANSEITPGFTAPALAHVLHHLHPRVVSRLKLKKHGLRFAARAMPTIALGPEGRRLVIDGGELRGDSADREAYARLRQRLLRMAGALRPSLGRAPPRLGGDSWADRIGLARLGWSIRRLGQRDMRDFLRIVNMNAADLLDDELSDDLLKGALAFDSVLGSNFGPRSPGSVLTWLYRLAGDGLAIPVGGMGAVAKAIAAAALNAGAEIRTGAPVRRILVEGDRARGVELDSGERLESRIVVSNADPRTTFLSLLGPEYLDTGFVRRVNNIRMNGLSAKLNLALDGLPAFAGLNGGDPGGRLVIAPDIGYLERAFDHGKYGEFSAAPAIEFTIPTIHDDTLAPEGKHVLSAIVQYAPYDLKGGWDARREAFADLAVRTIAAHAPDLPGRIVARQLLAPPDIEREFRAAGGHWHHGDLAIDQMMMMRPVPGAAQYETPLPGLYLCGAGAHPGGGVMGAAGMNAAARIIANEAKL